MNIRNVGHTLSCTGIAALLALLASPEVWAHRCGPDKLAVKKGNTVSYKILPVTGPHYVYTQIVNKGDPLVAKIDSLTENGEDEAVFEILGTGIGTTEFKIDWDTEYRRGGCYLEVTVSE